MNTYKGLSFWDGLLLLFIAYKLADIIEWSWWWVLAPAWASLGIAIIVAVLSAGKRR